MAFSRRVFLSAVFGSGSCLAVVNPLMADEGLERLRYHWKNLEIAELIDSRPRRSPGVSANSQKELVDARRGKRLALNGTAMDVWSLCDGGHRVDDMAGELSGRYEIDVARCRLDVVVCLLTLKRYGFIEIP